MSEDSLRHLEDTIKWNSIYMWGSQEEKKERKRQKDFQRTWGRKQTFRSRTLRKHHRRLILRCVTIKLSKVEDKERILKEVREMQPVYAEGSPSRTMSRFLSRKLAGWKVVGLCPRTQYPAKLSFRIERNIKSFPVKQKLKECITIRPALQ